MKNFWNMLMLCGVGATALHCVQVNAAEMLYEQWKEVSVVASRYPAIIPILQRSGYPAISVAPEYGTKAQVIERNCPVIAKSKSALSCGDKAKAPPFNADTIAINEWRFPTQRFWRPNIFDSMVEQYNNGDINRARAVPASTALRAAVASCSGITSCVNEVQVFFGVTIVSVPNLPVVGDLNEIMNIYYRTVISPTSPYDLLVNTYAGGLVCKALEGAELRTGCQ